MEQIDGYCGIDRLCYEHLEGIKLEERRAMESEDYTMLTIKQAAAKLHIAVLAIYNLVKKGQLKAYKLGGSNQMMRIKSTDIDAFVNDSLVKTDKESL